MASCGRTLLRCLGNTRESQGREAGLLRGPKIWQILPGADGGVLFHREIDDRPWKTWRMASLELVTLIVESYDPAIEFFVEKLGFDLLEDSPSVTHDGRPKRWVVVRPPGGQTGVLLAQADRDEQASTVGGQVAGRVGFFLRVDDFDQVFDRMVAEGVEFVSPPRTEPYGRVAVFLDIAGNRWDLLGPSEAKQVMTGDPLWAVLIPPRLIRFRELIQIDDDEQLDVDFTGWNKFVLLAAERAYLFPRKANDVEWFEREFAAYRALEPVELTVVPRLLGEWRDETVYPYTFAAVSRLPGTHPADASGLLDQLGRSIAQWHEIVPPALPGSRPPAHHDRSDIHWLRRALDPGTTRQAVVEAADRLGRADGIERWSERMEVAAQIPHVLVHGDIHEDQLLVVDGQLTGILDWETARIDHPFWDFDLSEWGTGLWRRHRPEFSRLWSLAWRSYASERGLDLDPSPLETAFRLRHALFLLDNDRDPLIAGTIDEHLAAI